MTFTDRLKAAEDLARALEAEIKTLRESEQATSRPDPTDIVVLTQRLCYDCMGPLFDKTFNEYGGAPPEEDSTDLWCAHCDIRWIAFTAASAAMVEREGDANETIQEVPKG